MSFLLSVTFACGVVIAVSHVVNRRFIAPVYDVVANLIAFGCAVGASVLLGHPIPAFLSSLAIVCWLVLARRTTLHRRERRTGLTHVAMSVPIGTLTDQFRAEVLSFYGEHFGWTELESLRLPDRMTIAIGRGDYLNVREMDHAASYSGYEHFGLRLSAAAAVEDAWTAIAADERAVELEPIQRGPDGYRQFRMRYLLPMTIEVQHLPDSVLAS